MSGIDTRHFFSSPICSGTPPMCLSQINGLARLHFYLLSHDDWYGPSNDLCCKCRWGFYQARQPHSTTVSPCQCPSLVCPDFSEPSFESMLLSNPATFMNTSWSLMHQHCSLLFLPDYLSQRGNTWPMHASFTSLWGLPTPWG